jgi:hypothetical protein
MVVVPGPRVASAGYGPQALVDQAGHDSGGPWPSILSGTGVGKC